MNENGDPGARQWDAVQAEIDRIKTELVHVEQMATAIRQGYFFDRFHAFDGIKDDRCPSCGGRVRVDESDPIRVRLESVPMVRAS